MNSEFFRINYSNEIIANAVNIPPSELLFQANVINSRPDCRLINRIPCLYPSGGDLGFDIFAAAFFMITRYEEYLPYTPDKNGRFQAVDSLSVKYSFLNIPVVNIWIGKMIERLQNIYPDFSYSGSGFKSIVTYDIDVAYAFKGHGLIRNLAASIKDLMTLHLKNAIDRGKTMLGTQKDPWDVYNVLNRQLGENHLQSIFFFLLGKYSLHNKNLNKNSNQLKELILELSKTSEIGLHPSFDTFLNPDMISREKEHLEKILNHPVFKSRQHYLKFKLPETYRYLLAAGIKEDYSMGYPESTGFRAGTCTPFFFYDLLKEKETDLKIFPVTVMEGSLFHYLKQSPEQAIKTINKLIEEVRNVNGTFISIWHNHTLSNYGEFSGWKVVHDNMINKLAIFK
ncbi:MAG: polysaccharide deacetylase family protein [Ginsengibacter sp.]